jgi:hypothetical protein
MTHFNIILQTMLAVCLCCPTKLCMHLSFACHIHALLILLDLISQVIFGQGKLHARTKAMKIFQNCKKYMYMVISHTEVWKGAFLSVSQVLCVIQSNEHLFWRQTVNRALPHVLLNIPLRKISNTDNL